jgi:lysophospholipase L1-like esterase
MIAIHIIGDSTASIKLDEKRPEHGWGELIHVYFNQDVVIKNYAKNGESTKSFKDRGLFSEAVKHFKPGDYLIIQFGHNDSKIIDPEKFTEPISTYQANLKFYVDEARKLMVEPIIFSSISRRYFISEKILEKRTVGLYPYAAERFAKNYGVKFIDMYSNTYKLYEYLKDTNSRKMFMHLLPNTHKNYPNGLTDNTHLNNYGARVIASLVAENLYRSKQTKDLKPYILKSKLLRKIDIQRTLNAKRL